jgi:hypothetical protein
MFGNAISSGDARNDSIGFSEELFGIFHGSAFQFQLSQVGFHKIINFVWLFSQISKSTANSNILAN